MIRYNTYNFLLLCLMWGTMCQTTWGQTNGCNSSYSRFGLGLMEDASMGYLKGMGGVNKAIRMRNQVNPSNPASYAAIDSLTMIIDAGITLSTGSMKGNGQRVGVNNASFDYVCAGFRLRRGLGFSLGLQPFTTIGYGFSTTQKVGNDIATQQPINSQSHYTGEGGLHKAYMGLGWNPFSTLSFGANIGYIWGEYNHYLIQTFDENGTTSKQYSGQNSVHASSIKTYMLDLGVQYPVILNEAHRLTIGATVGIGHNIASDATLTRYNTVGDSVQVVAPNAFDLPFTYGVGVALECKGRFLTALDYSFEQWAKCKTPKMSDNQNRLTYVSQTGAYTNRHKIAAGFQYVPNILSNRMRGRMHYRLGAHYSTPYLKVNNQDGPREYGISAGIGMPVRNSINHGPMIHVSAQWLRRTAPHLITEDYFMMNVAVSFAESWFMKFKIR